LSYGAGAITYILLLTRVKLSIAGPSAALIYICTVLIGCWVFQESLPIGRAIGLSFITLGVVLVLWKY
jgi:drug/metabolite transporter (DMT)-like permease